MLPSRRHGRPLAVFRALSKRTTLTRCGRRPSADPELRLEACSRRCRSTESRRCYFCRFLRLLRCDLWFSIRPWSRLDAVDDIGRFSLGDDTASLVDACHCRGDRVVCLGGRFRARVLGGSIEAAAACNGLRRSRGSFDRTCRCRDGQISGMIPAMAPQDHRSGPRGGIVDSPNY
jgi:hypothetical protein